jgi:sugar phosphate isomerase/epimerase
MNPIDRRQFIRQAAVAAGGLLMSAAPAASGAAAHNGKMTVDLVCGAIGVKAMQREAIELAARHGFESVEAQPDYLALLPEEQVLVLKSEMKAKGLVFGAAGLPVEFRRDDAQFGRDLGRLPEIAAGLKRAGVERVTTWIMPCHKSLTYRQQFRQHAERLKEVARVLNDFGLRLGLEYVGPKTTWSSQRFPFIHTMIEMKELLAAIDTPNAGFLLDSWHWWHAGETAEDILTLRPEQVVAVDLNDAPVGIAKEEQVDSKRELPCASGVIDVAAFLNALNRIGYDGPVRAEPFNAILAKMAKDDACAATASALKKALSLIQP